MSDAPRRPRAFRLDATEAEAPPAHRIEEPPDPYERESALAEDEAATERAQASGLGRRRFLSWGALFWTALGGLLSLAFGLWVARLAEDLFTRFAALGWIAVALAAAALLALIGLASREIRAILRQRRIADLHLAFARARETDDRDAARRLVRDLLALYAGTPTTARARADLEEMTREIIDGRDLIDIAERGLMHERDAEARREIAAAARRVSVVTAVSPRALVDVLFVAAQSIRLMRRIAEIYGGRPGFLGFLRLARSVFAHLAITGGMAVGDSILQQAIGHGLAAKLSAKLGEGVLNGLLTARVGLSAMAVCRPMPFAAEKPPGVRDVASFLFSGS